MTNYDLLPINSALPGVRLYGDSMQAIRRGQNQVAERHANVTGSTGSTSDGLQPGEVRLSGTWLGSDAKALADRLRAIVDDIDVEEVSIDSVNTTTELDGDYRLADEQTIERVATETDAAWRYEIRLLEQ